MIETTNKDIILIILPNWSNGKLVIIFKTYPVFGLALLGGLFYILLLDLTVIQNGAILHDLQFNIGTFSFPVYSLAEWRNNYRTTESPCDRIFSKISLLLPCAF